MSPLLSHLIVWGIVGAFTWIAWRAGLAKEQADDTRHRNMCTVGYCVCGIRRGMSA